MNNGSEEWIRLAEVVILAVVGGLYLWALLNTTVGLAQGRARTRSAAKYAVGRIAGQLGFLCGFAGATFALVDNWNHPLTMRSVFWMLMCWFAFVRTWLLDRGRWEEEDERKRV